MIHLARGASVRITDEMRALAAQHYAMREASIRPRFRVDASEYNRHLQDDSLVGEMCFRVAIGQPWDRMRPNYSVADRGDVALGRVCGDIKTTRGPSLLYNEQQLRDNLERYGPSSIVIWGLISDFDWRFLGACRLERVAAAPLHEFRYAPARVVNPQILGDLTLRTKSDRVLTGS